MDRNYGTAERLGSELRRTPYGAVSYTHLTQAEVQYRQIVALLTECVDRNYGLYHAVMQHACRTPYGVRG